MNPDTASRAAALSGFLAVGLGAFGAHSLKSTLVASGMTDVWEKAVLYHLVHALVLLMLARELPARRWAYLCFAIGMLLFSGSLYLLAVSGVRWLGAITPLGGLCLLAGWFLLSVSRHRVAA